jgi:hypothetical protein
MFALISLVVGIVLAVVDSVIFGTDVGRGGVFGAIYSLGALVASLAIGVVA